MTANSWCDEQLELGEGARWVDGRLVLVDILAGRLYEHAGSAPGPLALVTELDVPLGAVAPVRGMPGEWIAAAGTGIARLSADGSTRWLDRPEDVHHGRTRMNDGACDPSGRFWAGSMAYDGTSPLGSLYRVDQEGTVSKILDGLAVANGPAFTADGRTMFLADSARGIVWRYAVDPATGELGAGTVIISSGDGAPDGMAVDSDDRLWIAIWGGSAVRCYTNAGTLLFTFDVPTPQPTSVCILNDRLVVTTARFGLPEPGPNAGRLFAFEIPGLSARPAAPYRQHPL